jgi:hypothetical protein
VLLLEHTENHADGPTSGGPPTTTSKPTTPGDAYSSVFDVALSSQG